MRQEEREPFSGLTGESTEPLGGGGGSRNKEEERWLYSFAVSFWNKSRHNSQLGKTFLVFRRGQSFTQGMRAQGVSSGEDQ